MPETERFRSCVFCEIVAGQAPATVVREWSHALAIVPLDPVTPGHLLVLPRKHVRDVAEDPNVSADAMWAASQVADETGDCNVITSRGRVSTQSVFHLHLHVVPRRENDGLALPWYSGKRQAVLPDLEQVHGGPRHRDQAGECTRCFNQWPCPTAAATSSLQTSE